ncbi:MAG: tyrosine-type recombinase/integrase [Microcoleus sp. PH2017_10_PVI_O_A]|uniref:tyrosine-type recombinase/integrase n=1 Tax=unclassified Microcoleus TaxID=2642155 RepID=UPI001DF44D3E|nr:MULTISPECIES: tyrosine-type recombinase/integrase [unclassified Microcoleus]MCC3409384.1 tyrosine-type recombinase/integrase [Microcoleus sp. PH2017_10_PVI_O_A]MCC3463627.1 tyrosine-type recombinase/integrase [Microcoleus sp. PH2017_11_PCY_U_A]MCC3481965.1 tyrosine-type recombinase/integrase [Microcoleus sp. PH2017_12_PCY_D_A]MCC3532328.1 tyrosine-type recombinase/integrase [Microcoleus sp. PH2017_21_RUC_O_A]MCC3544619.1 tyrosine-type recombinase/integrase [Microcoleus sp. PH2017_22_RUC_O_B
MTSDSKPTKSTKGSISVVVRGKMLCLSFPRTIFPSQKRLALGISNTPENHKLAELKAKQIELDFLSGNFDATLEKYKLVPTAKKVEAKPVVRDKLFSEIYQKYIDSRRKLVSPSTWKNTYQVALNHLISCPYKQLNEAIKLKDWAIENRTLDTAKRILMQLNAALEWAAERGEIEQNPLKGKAAIKTKKISKASKIHPFSGEEKLAIIQAFQASEEFGDLAPIIKFFFLTGCRTGEAIALQWRHIKSDLSAIAFEETLINAKGGVQRKSGTKQSDSRTFPCNQQLQELLRSLKPESPAPADPVFIRQDGSAIAYHHLRSAWYGEGRKSVGLVKRLAIEGQIEVYRPQYNTRHTFISQCLESGIPVTQIAEWAGNSSAIIFQRYAGIIQKFSVPEF